MADTTSSSSQQQQQGAFQGSNLGGTITSIAQAGAVIAQTVANINDQKKRLSIEANLALLSEKDQIALAQRIANTQNSLDKTTLLVNVVEASRNAAADRAQKANTVKWILIGSAGVVVLGILAWYLKRK